LNILGHILAISWLFFGGHFLAISWPYFGSAGKYYYIIIYKLYSKLWEYKWLDTVSNALSVPVPGTEKKWETLSRVSFFFLCRLGVFKFFYIGILNKVRIFAV
jgi:hypothetical protein